MNASVPHATAHPGPAQLLEYALARALLALPPSIQRRLAAGGPEEGVTIDGLTLAPELQLLLAARRWTRAPHPTQLPPAHGRRRMRRDAVVGTGRPDRVGAIRDLTIDGAAGPLRARHYAPAGAAAGAPLLVFFHGGGFVLGDLDTHDGPCRTICKHAGVHVLAVDYRLAPEHPFPAAVFDALAAFAWAKAHAAELGADPARVAVGGDSAGGNLAAVVALETVRLGLATPALQLLIYPCTDLGRQTRSAELFAEGFLLTRADMTWFEGQYTDGTGVGKRDPRVSPAAATNLVGLAPAIVATAGFDPLRDEGEAYAAQLRAAGTPTRVRRFDSLVHGFINLIGVSDRSRVALVSLAAELKDALDTPGRRTAPVVAAAAASR